MNLQSDEINYIVNKWKNYIYEIEINTYLFHGTMNNNFMNYMSDSVSLKNTWFTEYRDQSFYHMFDGYCGRAKPNMNHYPCVYQFITKRKLKLLNLQLIYNDLLNTNEHYLIKQIQMHPNININIFPFIGNTDKIELKLFNIAKLNIINRYNTYNTGKANIIRSCDNTIQECNNIILGMIEYINSNSDMKLDGYRCFNDQKEIALTYNNLYNIVISDNIGMYIYNPVRMLSSDLINYANTIYTGNNIMSAISFLNDYKKSNLYNGHMIEQFLILYTISESQINIETRNFLILNNCLDIVKKLCELGIVLYKCNNFKSHTSYHNMTCSMDRINIDTIKSIDYNIDNDETIMYHNNINIHNEIIKLAMESIKKLLDYKIDNMNL